MPPTPPVPYTESLMDELDAIADAFDRVLDLSGVRNIAPNRGGGGGITFLGYPTHGWEPSDSQLEALRMALLTRVREWAQRFRLLFPNPTAQVQTRHDDAIALLENWLERGKKGKHSVPSTMAAALVLTAAGARPARHAKSVHIRWVADLEHWNVTPSVIA